MGAAWVRDWCFDMACIVGLTAAMCVCVLVFR